MLQMLLFIKLLLVHYATQSQTEIQADCNDNVSLKCPGVDIDSINFISVSWYKLDNGNYKGIIRRSKGGISAQYYNFNCTARFGEEHSLFLPSVTPEDSGTYKCTIGANVGGQNVNCIVNLTIHACVTPTDLTTMTDATNTTQDSNLLCDKHFEELPVTWSIIGYVAVGLAKIILSLISIWVIEAIRVRSSRREQLKW